RMDDAAWCAESAERALARLRSILEDGRLPEHFRQMQTAILFALRLGVFTDQARAAEAKAALLKSIEDRKHCLATGFLGSAFILDELTELGEAEHAYSLLLSHGFPSWLYSVDQGATTVWERWNSYTKKDGFGPVDMNSFNHYAYGSVLAWMFRHAAGIASDPATPGFRKLHLAPKPDRRLGFMKASYRSAAGLIRSEWHYEGEEWIWSFTVPEGATADVVLPWESKPAMYPSGSHQIRH
ncbi:MAG: glycosyl hydrolase family 18, partial [Kiritimatiellae bacterium]|nr:glycosyl hydrolase family 18 [Kiritimatiellia bacterium]